MNKPEDSCGRRLGSLNCCRRIDWEHGEKGAPCPALNDMVCVSRYTKGIGLYSVEEGKGVNLLLSILVRELFTNSRPSR